MQRKIWLLRHRLIVFAGPEITNVNAYEDTNVNSGMD